MSHFDRLPTDVKLFLFSFLNTQDVMAVTSTSKSNHRLHENQHFWRQRMLRDFKTQVPVGHDPKEYYLHLQKNRIMKIRDIWICALGIDKKGKLHIIDGSYDPDNKFHAEKLQTIAAFSTKHKIIDVVQSAGNSTFFLTPDGVYGTDGSFKDLKGYSSGFFKSKNDIRLFYQTAHDEEIKYVAVGMHFLAVQTTKHIKIIGDISKTNKYNQIIYDDIGNIKSIQSGSYKLIMHRDDNSFIGTGNDYNRLFEYRLAFYPVKNTILKFHELNDFCEREIKSYATVGEQFIVWCDDGIYVSGSGWDGRLGIHIRSIGVPTRLDFFNDKIITNVHVSPGHILVECEDGMYAVGMNKNGRLGTGDNINRHEFTKLDISPNSLTNVQLTQATFLEIHGIWHMAGNFYFDNDAEKHKLNFIPVSFTPLEEVVHHHRPAKSIA